LGFVQDVQHGLGHTSIMDAATADRKWEVLFADLVRYKEEHGNFIFGVLDQLVKQDRLVSCWARQQRVEYQKLQRGEACSLTALRLSRLSAIGFDVCPKPEHVPWEQRLQSLREFAAERGHLKIPANHPLKNFVTHVRRLNRLREDGKPSALTDERLVSSLTACFPSRHRTVQSFQSPCITLQNDLMEIGLEFNGKRRVHNPAENRKTWEDRFQELLAFKESHGHTLVPCSYHTPLAGWARNQRDSYRWWRKGEKSQMTAEKALRLTEIGFLWDASRVRGHTDREALANKRSTSSGLNSN